MSDDNQGSAKGILIAVGIGAVVGAGIGLLLAPRSGVQTRKMLARKAQQLKKRGESVIESGKESIRLAAKEL